MNYERPESPRLIKDKKYTWVCAECNNVMKTEEDKKPERCNDCGSKGLSINRHYIF